MKNITDKIYIGIDFSLKSPAVCIFKNNTYTWLSVCDRVTKPKRDIIIQDEVRQLNDIIMSYNNDMVEGNCYTSKHNALFSNSLNISNKLLDLIFNEFKDIDLTKVEFNIGFEGYSFNSFSSSNNIIDIVTATTIFKDKLLDRLDGYKYSIEIIAPISIKKYAGYSKFTKVDMFDIFTNRENLVKSRWSDAIKKDYEKKILKNKDSVFKWNYSDNNLKGSFYEYCINLELKRTVKSVKVPKPIDDMIDAYFVCCYLKDK